MKRQALDLLITKAKSFGDSVWYAVETFSYQFDDAPKAVGYDRFATMCTALHPELGTDTELAELMVLEAFLRAGKYMPAEAKLTNRKRADDLIEKILKR